MKILHLMLANFYIDNYSYQENLLPKFHKLNGNNVEIIASLFTFDENGCGKWLPHADKYINEYGIPVTRLAFSNAPFSRKLRKYEGLAEELDRVSPDVIFIHGVQFSDISIVVKYLKKNRSVRVFVDNHADFSNSAKSWISKYILHQIIWRHYAQMINPYVKRFYGVLPARVDFLSNVYGIPREKIKLLVMGADDEAVHFAASSDARKNIRKKYNIDENDFLIMNGGKIDNYKRQTLLLMDAVNNFNNPKVKLIVFGSVIPELKKEIEKRCSDRVQYIGWIRAEESYSYFAACDLACFPGRHSVFWEQVVGQGIPIIVKKWTGTTHVNVCGNARFLEKDSVKEITDVLRDILIGNNYNKILSAAKKASINFMYSDIAKKSIT